MRLQCFANKRAWMILILSFSSGLPLALTGSTLQAWMVSEKVDIKTIGLFSLAGLPYTLKIFWAPLMDRYVPPFLGKRRGWIALTQISLILTLIRIAFCHPSSEPLTIAVLAFFISFFSASQDTVNDACKTEMLSPQEFGVGAAISNLGFRLALLFSGSFALILSDHLSWKSIYLIMAACMGLNLFSTLFISEPRHHNYSNKNLTQSIIDPFVDFFKRKSCISLLLFILLYRLDVVITFALMPPFILSLGFSNTDLGAVTKGFGLFSAIVGTFVGGSWLIRLGLEKSLWIFGLFQGFSGICFCLLAQMGHHYPMMITAVAVENFCSGMGNAAYSALFMSLCNPKFTATQYALLTSLMALTRTVAGAPTGWMAEYLGWEHYFLVSVFFMLPGLLLLTRFKEWFEK